MASFPLLFMAGRFCLPVFPPKILAPKVPAKATVSRRSRGFPPNLISTWPLTPGDRHKETVLPDPRREEKTLYRLETKRKRGFFYRRGARRDRETVLSLLPLLPTCILHCLLTTLDTDTWYLTNQAGALEYLAGKLKWRGLILPLLSRGKVPITAAVVHGGVDGIVGGREREEGEGGVVKSNRTSVLVRLLPLLLLWRRDHIWFKRQ